MNEEEPSPSLHAFAGYGIELEYMIVDREHLSVLPIADRLLGQLLHSSSGNEIHHGLLGWSNELALHVIEVKNLRPSPSLSILRDAFQNEIQTIDQLLHEFGARLMPGAMHPWMDPMRETRLWPYDNEAIYRAYHRIFNSRSHGWSNLQSMHVNLPFANDEEFARLHAAVRLIVPILPALAASSPIADGNHTGWADYRMHVYSTNSESVPSITGMIVPESINSRADYERHILAPMYRDIAPHDPEQVLRQEWLNSRGAIARFDRNAIEIRVIDTQECPRADLAIAAATVSAVQALYQAGESGLREQQEIPTGMLAEILQACSRDAEQTRIEHPRYLHLLGFPGNRCNANELWKHLTGALVEEASQAGMWRESLRVILEQGPLARRILRAVRGDFSPSRLRAVYRELCSCLYEGRMFEAR